MHIDLPGEVGFECPVCRIGFRLGADSLSGRPDLNCPFCSIELDIYQSIEPGLRSRIYHAIRNAVEQRVYEQQLMDRGDYFEDSANLGTNIEPESGDDQAGQE